MVATDNRNRTVSDIRHAIFPRAGAGTWANKGSVAWMFERKSQIVVEKDKIGEDALMNLVLEAGAEDMKDGGDSWEVISDPAMHDAVLAAIQNAGIETIAAEVGMIPKNLMELEGKNAAGMVRLLDTLEEHDDVQNVYSNFDASEEDVED